MTIQAASDPTWHIRASEPEYTKWADEGVWHDQDADELPADKRPGSESPHIRPRR